MTFKYILKGAGNGLYQYTPRTNYGVEYFRFGICRNPAANNCDNTTLLKQEDLINKNTLKRDSLEDLYKSYYNDYASYSGGSALQTSGLMDSSMFPYLNTDADFNFSGEYNEVSFYVDLTDGDIRRNNLAFRMSAKITDGQNGIINDGSHNYPEANEDIVQLDDIEIRAYK